MEDPQEIQINKPQYFRPNKNTVSQDWRLWKQDFLMYLDLTKARSKLSEMGLAYLLLNFMGPVGIEAKEDMTFSDPSEEENMDILLKKFDEVFDPPTNEIEERYKFFSRYKFDTETIQNYVTFMKKQAAKCNFGDQAEKFILDMVVLNMDSNLKQQIFLIENVSLSVAIKRYEEYLLNEEKLKSLCDASFPSIKKANDDFPRNIKGKSSKAENIKDPTDTMEKLSNLLLNDNKEKEKSIKMSCTFEKCAWCDSQHLVDQCQHNKKCQGCKKFPHKICFNCKKNPHDENCSHKKIILPTIDLSKGPVCSKCNTFHLVEAKCNAHNLLCKNCFTPGHIADVCEKKGALNAAHKVFLNNFAQEKGKPVDVQEKNKPIKIQKKDKSSDSKIEDCSWCELQHEAGQCKHNFLCRSCDDFPHNVCFFCKNNPHTDVCQFKKHITLPAISVSKNDFSQRRGQVCPTCFETGHSSDECYKVKDDLIHKQSNERVVNEEFQSRVKNVAAKKRTLQQPNQDFSKQTKSSTATLGVCPICNSKDLHHYDEDYDFCKNCENYVAKIKNQSSAGNVCPECGTCHQPNQCPTKNKNNTKRVCFRCNTQHPRNQCPAYNARCSNCNKLGHFSHACKSKTIQNSFSTCPMCNKKCLEPYDDVYDYCDYYKVHIAKTFDDDSYEDCSYEEYRNRQSNNDESCSIL